MLCSINIVSTAVEWISHGRALRSPMGKTVKLYGVVIRLKENILRILLKSFL